jgi:hypothetical protein
MTGKRLRVFSLTAAVAVLLLGGGLGWHAWRLSRLSPFTPLATEFLTHAAFADSVALVQLAAYPEPVARVLSMQRVAPEELAVVRRSLRLSGGLREASRALVVYETEAHFCPAYMSPRGTFHFQFVRGADAWLVEYAGPPPC